MKEEDMDHATDKDGDRINANVAPYPYELESLVNRLLYRAEEGWRYSLDNVDRGQGSKGLTFTVLRVGPDSYHPERILRVNHFFSVPPAAYNEASWTRWLFDQIRDVELHETMENFKFGTPPKYDAETGVHRAQPEWRPYAPNHGPGHNPYLIRELTTDEDRRTSFRGELKPARDPELETPEAEAYSKGFNDGRDSMAREHAERNLFIGQDADTNGDRRS